MPENEYKYLDHAGLTRFKGKIQDILDTKVDKENGKYIVTVDSELSSSSTNPVQNKVIAEKLGSADISSIGDGTVTGAIDALNTDRDPQTVQEGDANNYIGKNLIQYGNRWLNGPIVQNSCTGWLINLTHGTASAKSTYNKQIFHRINPDEIYSRIHVEGVFSSWQLEPMRSEITQLNTVLGVICKPSITIRSESSAILTWLQNNYVANNWIVVRSSPTNGQNTDFFKQSSFSIFANMSSQNYGFGWAISDTDSNNGLISFRVASGSIYFNMIASQTQIDQLGNDRNIVLDDNNTVITLAGNTTSFTAFDTLISSLRSLQGKTFEVQVDSGVVLDGIAIGAGRKFAQILRHSSTDYAVIHMFGWANEGDQYRITKYNNTWSCVKLPSRGEVNTLNTNRAILLRTSTATTAATLMQQITAFTRNNGMYAGFLWIQDSGHLFTSSGSDWVKGWFSLQNGDGSQYNAGAYLFMTDQLGNKLGEYSLVGTSSSGYTITKLDDVTSGTLTKLHSSISAVEYATWYKLGRIAMISLKFTTSADINDMTNELFSGAPIPFASIRGITVAIGSIDGDKFRYNLATDGILKQWYTPGTTTRLKAGQYELTLTYITAS